VTVPLGFLPIKVVNAAGVGLSGLAVTATVTDPNRPADNACEGLSFTVGTSGSGGLVGLDVPYETYKLSVAGIATGTVVLAPTDTVYTPLVGNSVAQLLPTAVAVRT
jgi:hypothetical protein